MRLSLRISMPFAIRRLPASILRLILTSSSCMRTVTSSSTSFTEVAAFVPASILSSALISCGMVMFSSVTPEAKARCIASFLIKGILFIRFSVSFSIAAAASSSLNITTPSLALPPSCIERMAAPNKSSFDKAPALLYASSSALYSMFSAVTGRSCSTSHFADKSPASLSVPASFTISNAFSLRLSQDASSSGICLISPLCTALYIFSKVGARSFLLR